jgi:repressor LexA
MALYHAECQKVKGFSSDLGYNGVVKLTAKEFGRRLRKARLERMLTQAELAEAIGRRRSLIGAYEAGVIHSVPFETIERLASVLGKPVSYFTGERDEVEDEIGYIRERVDQIYRALHDKVRERTVPLLGSVVAGNWESAVEDETGERVLVPPEIEGIADYALRVRGDSMIPTLYEGDLLFVSRNLEPRSRDVVVVRNADGEVSVKRYIKFKDKVMLRPDNPSYEPLSPDEAEVLGVVIMSVRRFR